VLRPFRKGGDTGGRQTLIGREPETP
jgi:hypothetical protein